MADVLEVILLLRNLQQFVAGAEEASAAVEGVGKSTEKAGKTAQGGWKGMVKWAAGATLVYGGAKFLHSAAEETGSLAKQTLAFSKITGMDTQTASEWVSLTKERGVTAKQFSIGLVRLSKQIDTARTGTDKSNASIKSLRSQIDQVAAAGGKDAPKQIAKLSGAIQKAEAAGLKARTVMSQLGIPLSELQGLTTDQTLMKVADAFQKSVDPANRAALAQKLFGRSGVTLLPVLSKGSKGVQELLDEQKKAGNYLSDKGLKQTMSVVQQQRALSKSFEGMKVQLSLAVIPAILMLGRAFVWFMDLIRPITSNAKAMRVVLIAVVGALIALKAATIAESVAAKENTMITKAWAAAQWLLNAAMEGNPFVLAAAAVIALGIAFYEAYKHVAWFRNAVNLAAGAVWKALKFVWDWVKQNWPLLVGMLAGPFGLAVALVITHWGQVKNAVGLVVRAVKIAVGILTNQFHQVKKVVLAIIAAVKRAIQDLVNWVTSLPGKIGKTLKKIPGVSTAIKVGGGLARAVGLQAGGTVTTPGGFLVGERGPEIVALPAGAAVTPMPAGGNGGGLVVEVPVYLDRHVLARATARVTADKLARR